MTKTVLIILGHSEKGSLCHGLADEYESSAKASGFAVSRLNVGDLKFDPILWHGYNQRQELEPDLIAAQEHIKAADHIVFIFPIWWGTMPALLKGFIDRTILPGYGFKYNGGQVPKPLLTGKTARIITTMDTPPWYYRYFQGAKGLRAIEDQILAFCGFRVRKSVVVGPVRDSSAEQRAAWVASIASLASKAG